jgi:general secretion pathway protein D
MGLASKIATGGHDMNKFARSFKWRAVLIFVLPLLISCVTGQMQHEEGLALLDEGKTEEGLAKLQEAVKADPHNVSYRVSLARNREQSINRQLAVGNNERIAGHQDSAQAAYLWVLKIDPHNARARQGLAVLEMDKRHNKTIAEVKELIRKGDLDAARDELRIIFMENPDNAEALALQRQTDEIIAKEQSAGPALMAKFKKPITLEFRDANVKMVFEALSRTSGINVLLDKDVKPDLKTSISVKDATVEDTIDLILLQNQLDKKVLNDNTVFIYPNTAEKNKSYRDLKVRSFHLIYANPKQMMEMIKSLLKTKDIYINEKTNSIVIRDTPEAIRLAEKMILDQDTPEPEVMLEVEVLEVNRSLTDQLGINWPSKFSVATTATNLRDLKNTNAGTISASSLGVTLDLLLTDADTNILASPRIRARNREKAKIMIGDRVPVITNAVTPVSTGTPVVTGSVQYLDVGLKLEVEPEINLNNEVAIKINMEVSTLKGDPITNAVSGTVAYQVSTRNASTLLQLTDGETQILAGLIDNEDRANSSKVPGLGQLPILGHLFSDHGSNNTKTEIVLSITPHIVVKSRRPDARDTEYWSGTEATLRDSQLLVKPIGSSTTGAQAATRSQQPAHIEAPAPAAPSPMVFSWQGPSQAKVGDTISLTLNTQSVQGMNNLGLLVNFDHTAFKVVDAVEGNLLKQGNIQSKFSKVINQNNGQVEISLAGHSTAGVFGDGSVVTLTLEVTGGAPQSQITVSRITPTRSGGIGLAYTPPAPYSMTVSK